MYIVHLLLYLRLIRWKGYLEVQYCTSRVANHCIDPPLEIIDLLHDSFMKQCKLVQHTSRFIYVC